MKVAVAGPTKNIREGALDTNSEARMNNMNAKIEFLLKVALVSLVNLPQRDFSLPLS